MVPAGSDSTKARVLQLMADKDKLEAKISEYGEILKNNADIGMKGSLVDADGFPRNDIDVYQVRQARQQIICSQNDYKELMKQIEVLMHKLHAEAAVEQSDLPSRTAALELSATNGNGTAVASSDDELPHKVIAKINVVTASSPAEDAGLCVGDEILQFGTINANNFSNNLNEIAAVVGHMENQRISLKIKRNGNILDMILIPKKWSGRGLLGCNIVLAAAN